jgi:hypothetical protein
MSWIGAKHGWGAAPEDASKNAGPRRRRATVFIAIDGESFRDDALSSLERDPYEDDGGES